MKRLNAHLIIDEATEYRLESSLAMESRGAGVRYTPQVEITIPNRKPIRLSSILVFNGLRRSSVEINIDNIYEQPLNLAGTISRTN